MFIDRVRVDSRASNPMSEAQMEQGSAAPSSPPVVFFVDDDDQLRWTTATILRKHDFEVLEAATAEEAVIRVEAFTRRIDVLLMDINLPDGWGATVAQRLSEIHPEMAVVYTTGFAETDPILSGGLNDAPYVLRKPFTAHDLLTVLEDAMVAGPNAGEKE